MTRYYETRGWKRVQKETEMAGDEIPLEWKRRKGNWVFSENILEARSVQTNKEVPSCTNRGNVGDAKFEMGFADSPKNLLN